MLSQQISTTGLLVLLGLATSFTGLPGAEAAPATQVRVVEPTVPGTCLFKAVNPFLRAVYNHCPPPLTDIKRIRPYRNPPRYPWTHPVRCLKTKGSEDTPRKGHDIRYCLYSDSVLGGLHGVSLLTAPEIAADVVSADALEDRPYYGGSRHRDFVPGPINGAYMIQPTPGKGLGVVAARKIAQGEIAMLDLPAVLLSKAFLEDTAPLPRRRLIRRGLSQLPAETQKRVFALSTSTGGDVVDAILGTNTISLALGMNQLHLGLYPELSRINHACNPNAYYRFSHRTLSIEVVAYRDIQPGEEITISYAQLTLSRTERRAFLQNNWHFNCSCSLCRADPDAMTLSEDRRRDMRKLQATLVQASRSGEYDLALLTAETLQETTEAEGVTPLHAEMYDIVASIHLDMRNFNQAERFGRMALEAWERFDSVDDSQLVAARWFLSFVEQARRADEAERLKRERDAADEAAMEDSLEDFF
ncbi:hypothetical protein HMPREF1624_02122 [Sporothrix schenckii ATCC 58251]|uniref:SET domain-containing protein n=1 Tax=Sporothrix schenckii (strain ATCC 58251 / de Perez 2211183) TaxID=1391915 RepID=U7PZ87_SPOS1|nr:hypothetical protein HMPREF1624_02122 [Sporothrix schenckii ATCC 58251]